MEEERGNFYVFEGMDGVGKSTTAEAFADSIDAAVLSTPGPGIAEVRDYVDADIHSEQTRFLLYLGSVSAVSDHVERHLEAGNDIVVDRYYPSTLVYRNAGTDEDWFPRYEEFDFVEPDAMFYLWVDEETRLERVYGREQVMKDEEVDAPFMDAVRDAYDAAVERYDMIELEAVDGVDTVVEQALGYVEGGDR